ncbi:phosphatase PAP2 family protein [Candidatus Parcubacteria bacterium]|nr:phosphatase PAP2 family protein [Candidatus Parcubacteria bacterium]
MIHTRIFPVDMTTDECFSQKLFDLARTSPRTRDVAIFCASQLVWLMVGFAIGPSFPLSLMLAPILFLPWGVSLVLSQWVKRPRPFHQEHYKPLIHLFVETSSFPSSHATVAFALVAAFVGDVRVWPFMLLGAILVALGRVAVGVHYASDVVVGALIGFGLGYVMNIAFTLFGLAFFAYV